MAQAGPAQGVGFFRFLGRRWALRQNLDHAQM